MSVAQNLKSGQSTTAGSSFTAYTGLPCPKHNVQMIAKLEVPPNATVRRLSDKVFTTTNAYIISMGHPGANCKVGRSTQDARIISTRVSVSYMRGLKIMLDSNVARKSLWGATDIDVWTPPKPVLPEPVPEKKEKEVKKEVEEPTKKEVVKKEVVEVVKKEVVKKEEEEPKKEVKEVVKKVEVVEEEVVKKEPLQVAPPLKRKTSRKKNKKKSPSKQIEDADESVMDKFFSDDPTASKRKNNVSN